MRNHLLRILPFLFWVMRPSSAQLIRDTRCFLENGATAAHLFVSEDLAVGDVVGSLGVLGDPSAQGDIELRLQERDSPVEISPYSKNLTLIRPLDKEGIDGPASVYVNVICERKRTLDPGFVIPVNIRVTDANDNAPRFVNAPYVLNISEVTVVGTRVLQGVRAVDADQPGPFSTVQYGVLPGPHSDYFVFVNALEGTLVLRKPLDYETLSNFSVGIRAQDQGNPPRSSTTTLYVNVIDADDQNPAFLADQYKVIVPRRIDSRKALRVEPAPIKAVDRDVGINAPVRYTIQGGILPFLTLDPETAEIVAIRSLRDQELVSPATIVIKATQVDNPDRYALSTIVVSREGDNSFELESGDRLPVKFTQKDYQRIVPENTPPGSVILTANVNKHDPNLRFWLVGALEDLERFSITNSGELILKGTLDYERRIQHSFLLRVTDGRHNDTSRVNITVEDVNEWEPRFRHPRYEFHARTLKEGTLIGRLEAADGDRGDKVTLSLRGPDARSFELRENGELILRSIGPFNGSMARLVAVASDSGRPPRSSMIPVIVRIPNGASLPIAARAAPAWLGSSVILVAVFGAVLGLLGVVILALILYIYKHKRTKAGGSVESTTSGYREKSPVPSALSPTPQVLGANALRDVLDGAGRNIDGSVDSGDRDDDRDLSTTINVNASYDEECEAEREEEEEEENIEGRNTEVDVDEDEEGNCSSRIRNNGGKGINEHASGSKNGRSYARKTKVGIDTAKLRNLYSNRKIAPASSPMNPPMLSASSRIPNIGGLVQNMNDLSARTNIENRGSDPDSLVPVAWPAGSLSPRVKKLSWNDDDDDDVRTVDSVEEMTERETNCSRINRDERLNLTVYF